MNFIKKWLFVLFMLSLFVVALLAAIDNSNKVALKFLIYETPDWPVSWWILAAFVMGTVFGIMLNLLSNARLRRHARAADKAAARRASELDRARSQGVVGGRKAEQRTFEQKTLEQKSPEQKTLEQKTLEQKKPEPQALEQKKPETPGNPGAAAGSADP